MVDMIPVDSTSLEQIGYDPATMELHVVFIGRPEVYVYLGVPPHVYERFIASDSRGTLLNHEIKDSYPFEKRWRDTERGAAAERFKERLARSARLVRRRHA